MTGLSVGDVVGGFVIESALGRGGMATVYRARDPSLDRSVALKLVDPLALGVDGMVRFLREAELAARVDGDGGVVRVHARGEHRGVPFLVLELVEGRDLAALFRDGQLEVGRLVRLVEQVARTIDRCHRAGVVHRDLKPGNVLVREEDDVPLVADFGLARDLAADRMTQTGVLLGTPAYMAPEQALDAARAIDPRVDVYALGAILYHGLTGQPPFGSGLAAVLRAAQEGPPAPSALSPGVDRALEAICLHALSLEPARRHATAAELADDLADWRAGARPSRRGRRISGALVALALLAIVLAGVALRVARASAHRDDVARAIEEARGLEPTLEALIAVPCDGPLPPVDLAALVRLDERLGVGLDGPELAVARERVEALRGALSGEATAASSDPLARAVSAWVVWRTTGPGAALDRLGNAGQRGGAVARLEVRLRVAASSPPIDLLRCLTAHRADPAVWPASRPSALAACAGAFRNAATSWNADDMTLLATTAASLDPLLPAEALEAALTPWRARLLEDLARGDGEVESASRLRVLLARAPAGSTLRSLLDEVYAHFDAPSIRRLDSPWVRPLDWDDAVSRLDPTFEPPERHRTRLLQFLGIQEWRDRAPPTFALSCVRRGVIKRPAHAITDLARFIHPTHEARLEQDAGGAAALCLAILLVVRHEQPPAIKRALEKALSATPSDISPGYADEARAYLARICVDLARTRPEGPERDSDLLKATTLATSVSADTEDTELRWTAINVVDSAASARGTPVAARVTMLLPLLASDPPTLERLLDRYDDLVTQDPSCCASVIAACVRASRLARAQTLVDRARAEHGGLAASWDALQRQIDAQR